VNIVIVDTSKATEIAHLAACLLNEIMERTGVRYFDVDVQHTAKLCKKYIDKGQYHVMAVQDHDRIIGFGAICESHSLYAEGAFGILQEFYVMRRYRSQGIGKQLLMEIVDYAKSQNWKRLELCTPPVPEFDRTVDFYRANGFEITGGYKMKLILD
jgi:GNAT superfamily N-acetyltransferase